MATQKILTEISEKATEGNISPFDVVLIIKYAPETIEQPGTYAEKQAASWGFKAGQKMTLREVMYRQNQMSDEDLGARGLEFLKIYK